MLPYVFLAAFVLLPAATNLSKRMFPYIGVLYFVVLAWFIGLRHSVGMDWNNYLRMIFKVGHSTDLFASPLEVSEPLYTLFLVLGYESGWGIYAVNLVSACIILWGLFSFLRVTREPWLALLVALPMFLVVISMSANRQALAAGLLMLAVTNWYRWSPLTKTAFILLCSTFHASALLFFAFVAIDLKTRLPVKIAAFAALSVVMFYVLQQTGRLEGYNEAYGMGEEMIESEGAIFHTAINALPAALYFLAPAWRDRLFPNSILRYLAFAALAVVPLVFISSTAASRITIYFFPVSIFVLSALPGVFGKQQSLLIRLGICAAMVAVMFGWLTLANSAYAHLPYENATLIPPEQLQIGVLP